MTSWVFTRTADGASAGSTVSSTLGVSGKTARTLVAYANAIPPTLVASSTMTTTSTSLTTPPAAVTYTGTGVISYWSDKSASNSGWTTPAVGHAAGLLGRLRFRTDHGGDRRLQRSRRPVARGHGDHHGRRCQGHRLDHRAAAVHRQPAADGGPVVVVPVVDVPLRRQRLERSGRHAHLPLGLR